MHDWKRRILLGLPPGGGRAAPGTAAALAARGWVVTPVRDAASLIAHATVRDYALCLLDAGWAVADGHAIAARIAAIPAPHGLLPVVTAMPDAPLPDDRALRDIAAAAPRLHAVAPDVLARLGALLGDAAVRGLLMRFRDRLGALLDAADPCTAGEGATIADIAHRVVGMAGMLDFPALSTAWGRVESDPESADGTALPAAWFETRIAHAALTLLLEPPHPDC